MFRFRASFKILQNFIISLSFLDQFIWLCSQILKTKMTSYTVPDFYFYYNFEHRSLVYIYTSAYTLYAFSAMSMFVLCARLWRCTITWYHQIQKEKKRKKNAFVRIQTCSQIWPISDLSFNAFTVRPCWWLCQEVKA